MSSTALRFPPYIAISTVVLLGLVGLAALFSSGVVAVPMPLSALAMLLAWLKGVVVAEYFMELRHAPWLLRGVVHAWLLLTCMGLVISSLV